MGVEFLPPTALWEWGHYPYIPLVALSCYTDNSLLWVWGHYPYYPIYMIITLSSTICNLLLTSSDAFVLANNV